MGKIVGLIIEEGEEVKKITAEKNLSTGKVDMAGDRLAGYPLPIIQKLLVLLDYGNELIP